MTAPLNILHIIDGLQVGGAEVLLLNIVQHLPPERFRVTVAYSTPGPLVETLQQRGVPLVRLKRLATLDPMLFWRMYQTIRQIKPEIVHTHLFKSDVHGRPAARLAGVPVVVSSLQNCNDWATWPVIGPAYGQTARFTDRLIAVSEEVRTFALQHTRVPANKVITIPNAVPLEQFDPAMLDHQAFRRELQISPDTPLVGIVARLMPQKDHATFLQAAAQIHAARPEVRFVIVGDGPLRAELEQQTQQLGLAEAVIFTGLRRDIPQVLAALNLLVFSSRWEGLPVALLEGMATARPVVATSVGGIPGVITDRVNGRLVAAGNASQLAEVCRELLNQPNVAHQLGQAGRQHILAHYSMHAMVTRIIELYDELLMSKKQA